MAKSASGSGTIRKKEVTRDGKKYTYWEARYTAGRKPDGTQLQKSITGKTQKEVAKKLKEATLQVDNGLWHEPTKMLLSEWLDIWSKNYLVSVKPLTAKSYNTIIKTHILPSIGSVRLNKLQPHLIQQFYTSLDKSAKTVQNVHGVLHKALDQAVKNGYIASNPTDSCQLPRVEKKTVNAMDDSEIMSFLAACSGSKYKDYYKVTLFLGLRESEALGLTWDCIDFHAGTVTIKQQLQLVNGTGGQYTLVETKSSNIRTIAAPVFVMDIFRSIFSAQLHAKSVNKDVYTDSNFVFCDETGEHYKTNTVYKHFKAIAAEAGIPSARVHDLRHSYAVACLRNGDDIKTLQAHLGHATASFTLDVYGHVTDQMQRDSAARMEKYYSSLSDKGKQKGKQETG